MVRCVRARDLVQDLPVVSPDDSALTAARLIAQGRLPGIAVVDADKRPVAVLPASQVLRFVVPDYVQEDPALARVVDEAGAERLCLEGLSGERVKDLLPSAGHKVELAAVDGDATVLGCAAVMARLRSPILVVVEKGRVLGLLTASHLLEVLLPAGDEGAQAATK
jgi:predicted transcriptional regulator